jgi:catalase
MRKQVKLSTRLTSTAAVLFALAASFPAAAQQPSTAEQTIDVMNKLFGRHSGIRANHAKGTVVEGSFTPSAEAAQISKAVLFKGPPVPVIARFSNATGIPDLPDGSPQANPHGLAVKFRLPDGSEMDVVLNALKFFPVATGEEFLALLKAASESGPNTPRPTPLERFVAGHPAAATAGRTARTPSSFARQVFNGVNAFVFVDGGGTRQAFRYRFEPTTGEDLLTPEDAAKRPPNFLLDEIRDRLGKEAVSYRVLAQLAQPGDPTNDATKSWPDDRRTIALGTLTINKVVADSARAEKELLFMPNALADGIEVSDDPLIDARVEAYAVSFGRRSQ